MKPAEDFEISEIPGLNILAVQAPLEILAKATKNFAYFNANPDPDGPIRSCRFFTRLTMFFIRRWP